MHYIAAILGRVRLSVMPLVAATVLGTVTPAWALPPVVATAVPDTLVVENSSAVTGYRDLNTVFRDPEDGGALSFSVAGNSNPGLVNVTVAADSSLDLSFAPAQYGSATVVIRAVDSELLSVADTFTVTVHHTLWRVHADRSGDAATIQAAINATIDGDTVLLSDGVYTGGGNHDISFNGKDILLTSENGPSTTIIDCQGAGRGFSFVNGEGPGAVVSNITLTNGSQTNGGGFQISGGNPTIRDLVVVGCSAARGGGMFMTSGGAMLIERCLFVGNTATDGGAIHVNGTLVTISNCTIVENSAATGGGIYFRNTNGSVLENSIVAFSTQGPGISCSGANPTIRCSDVFGNAGGNQLCGTDGGGNISADPQFCGPSGSGIVTLSVASPCAPSNNTCGILMGAFPISCVPGTPPFVVTAVPDTVVAKKSPSIDNYRDLNQVFSDAEDGDALDFRIQSNSNPALVAVTIDADSALDVSFAPARSGAATIVVRATDTTGLSAVDTFVVTVMPTMLSASASRVWTGAIHPGGVAQPMFQLTLTNNDAVPETLTTLSFTNVASGTGTVSQLDASFAALSLAPAAGAAILPGGAAGTPAGAFAAGRLTFAGLEAEVPPGGSLSLVLSGAASLSARDGDILDVAIALDTDLAFTDNVTTVGAWPLDPADQFLVDGFVAAQIQLHPVTPSTFGSGTVRNPALDVTLPANGYAADVLNRINVVNFGNAPVTDITAMEGWADDGDGVFDDQTDTLLGLFSFTGARWEITGLSVPVPPSGLRVFVTVDISTFAAEGHTLRLGLPPSPDLGAGMDSGNDGPLDLAVVNPFAQSIVSSESVVLAAVPLPASTAGPGAREALLLQLTATNRYADDRVVTRLTVHNRTTSPGPATQGNLDAEIERIELRVDGNDNGVLDDAATDPVVGTASFSAGVTTFNALSWNLPAGTTRQLFVTADVSPALARDADVLGAVVDGTFDVEFNDITAVVSQWPVDSGARVTIDGMLAAQISLHDVTPLTLAPSDGPVTALDVTLPANGYSADILSGLEVVNVGTATPGDVATLQLWRDGGDGVFTGGGDDNLVAPLVWTGSSWKTPVISQTLPSGGARLFVSMTVSGTPTDSTSVRLAIPVAGVTVASANDGPIDNAVASPQSILITTAPLLATLTATPAASIVGQDVAVRMTARNAGSETINGVTPSPPIVQGTATMNLVGGPVPASFNLAPGAVDTFTWVFNSASSGSALWAAACSGVGALSGLARASLPAASNGHTVFDAAGGLDLSAVASLPPTVVRGQTDVVPISLTFSTTGAAGTSSADIAAVRFRLEDALGNPIIPADLIARVVVSTGGVTYLTKTALETTGSAVDLVLATAVRVSTASPATINVRLDILATTAVPSFRVIIDDAASLTAEDAISGAPVPIALAQGNFPLSTGVARVVVPATVLQVNATAAVAQRVGWGQNDVAILPLRLDNPGVPAVTTSISVVSLAVSVTDSNGVVVPVPSTLFDQLRLVGPIGQIFSIKNLDAGTGAVVTLPLSPLASVAAGSPLDVTLIANVAAAALLGTYRVRLAAVATFDARDANSLAPVAVAYQSDPVEGSNIRIEAPALDLSVRGVAQFPETIAIGETDVSALSVVLRHPGAPGVGRLRVDGMTVRSQNQIRNPVVPSTAIARVRVMNGSDELANLTTIPTSGNAIAVTFADVFLEPGQSDTLDVIIDASAAAPESYLELLLDAGGVAVEDANIGTPSAVLPESGVELPLSSGLTRLLPPATELVVGLVSRMPAVLAAGSAANPVADITMKNTAAKGSNPITVERLVIRSADHDFAAKPIGSSAHRLLLYRDGSQVAASDTLSADSTTATLAFSPPFGLSPQETATLELRVDFGTTTATSVRFGFTDTDVGVDQPSSALFKIRIAATPGRTFPLWTDSGQFGGLSLHESFSNFPNPFAAGGQTTTFVYYLPRNGDVTLKIWTVRGEPVRTIRGDSFRGAGLYQDDQWDGRNGIGVTVVNGAYIAELVVRYADGARDRLLRKVAVVR